LLSAHPNDASEFEVIGLGLNFVIAAVGRALGRTVFEYFDKTESNASVASLRDGKGGIMANWRDFSPNASAALIIRLSRASVDPGRPGRSKPPSG
jgi:hypothetical protein